jgi:hypothetical protein
MIKEQDQIEAKALLATVRHMLTGYEIDNLLDIIDGYDELFDHDSFASLKNQFSKQIGDYIDGKGEA